MARLFVTSDDQRIQVEIDQNPIDGTCQAFCSDEGVDVLAGERVASGHSLDDVVQVVSRHVDRHGRAS